MYDVNVCWMGIGMVEQKYFLMNNFSYRDGRSLLGRSICTVHDYVMTEFDSMLGRWFNYIKPNITISSIALCFTRNNRRELVISVFNTRNRDVFKAMIKYHKLETLFQILWDYTFFMLVQKALPHGFNLSYSDIDERSLTPDQIKRLIYILEDYELPITRSTNCKDTISCDHIHCYNKDRMNILSTLYSDYLDRNTLEIGEMWRNSNGF